MVRISDDKLTPDAAPSPDARPSPEARPKWRRPTVTRIAIEQATTASTPA